MADEETSPRDPFAPLYNGKYKPESCACGSQKLTKIWITHEKWIYTCVNCGSRFMRRHGAPSQ